MARTEARMTCAIWDDEDYRDLTWEAQWLYETLLTQKDLSLCGVLTYTPKRFSKLARNATAQAIKKALDLLREKRYVVLDDDTDELLVRSLIRRDRVLANHNSVVGCSKAFEAIHSGLVRDAIVEEVVRVVREGVAIGATEGGTPTGWLTGLPDHIRKRVGQPFAHALALASTRPPPPAPVPPASLLLPPLLANTDPPPTSIDAGDEPAEEEEPLGRIDQACALVAQRRLDRRLTKPELEPITDRTAWLARTADRERQRIAANPAFAENMDRLADAGLSVNRLADLLDPPETPAASPYPAAGEQLAPAHVDIEFDDEGHAFAVRPVSA